MNFSYIKKILFDKENRLYELLKLKKKIESNFFNNISKGTKYDLKIILKSLLLTNSVTYQFNRNVIELISIIENKLNNNFSNFKKEGEIFKIESINKVENKSSFFDKLINFNTKLEKHNSNLIVQGSYADGTYINYSDIDLVIIGSLSQEVKYIKNRIEEFLLTIDPLQHHGVFFINKNSFKNYWQMDLPIDTLKKALVLSKTTTLEINISYFFNERLSSNSWILNFLNSYPILPITLDSGVFFTKYFISQLLLVPALFIATKGNYIYKRESFPIVKEYYSNEAWGCIKIASSIRNSWNQKNIDSRYKLARKNSTIKNIKEYNNFSDVVDMNEERIAEFATKYNFFIKETKELLVKI